MADPTTASDAEPSILDIDQDIIDFEPFLRRKRSSVCPHDEADVDDDLPSLTCRACGAELDPWWFLRRLAHEEIGLFEQMDRLDAHLRAAALRANAKIAALNAEIQRLTEIKNRLWNEQVDGRPLGTLTRRRRRA